MRGVRTRLLLVVVGALTVALALATIGFNVLLAHAGSSDANTELHARAAEELSGLRVVDNRIHVGERGREGLAESGVWIFNGTHVVARPRTRPEVDLAARALVAGPTRIFDVPGAEERLLAVPIESKSGRVGTLIVGISLAPYHHTRRTALFAALTVFVLVLVFAAAASWWLLRAALRPVARMTEQAATWSEEDLDRRFALGEPYDELTRLARTLDGLLERLAASLRHERRFSAEMSHELRTPLAKLMAEAELALRRERSSTEYRANPPPTWS